jgi:hypothetical protein
MWDITVAHVTGLVPTCHGNLQCAGVVHCMVATLRHDGERLMCAASHRLHVLLTTFTPACWPCALPWQVSAAFAARPDWSWPLVGGDHCYLTCNLLLLPGC